jgi:hypothetical protein
MAQIYMRKQEYKTARELLEKLSGNNTPTCSGRRRADSLAWQDRILLKANGPLSRRRESASDGVRRQVLVAGHEVVENPDPSAMLRAALRKPASR